MLVDVYMSEILSYALIHRYACVWPMLLPLLQRTLMGLASDGFRPS
jgi:hypothetical protein